MAAPLTGVGTGAQIPQIQQAAVGQNSANQQVRENREGANQTPQTNTVQAPGTPVADTQNAETGNQGAFADLSEQALAAAESGDTERGSLIDISV